MLAQPIQAEPTSGPHRLSVSVPRDSTAADSMALPVVEFAR